MFSTPTLSLEPFDVARKRIRTAAVAAYISAGLSTALGVGASIAQKRAAPLWLLPDAVLAASRDMALSGLLGGVEPAALTRPHDH